MATIKLTDLEYRALLNTQADNEVQIAALKKQLAAAERSDVEGRVQHLIDALSAARDVIGFAIAHLPPETVRGWPHERLRVFADLLETGPGVPYEWKEHAIDLKAFAREAEYLEQERANRK